MFLNDMIVRSKEQKQQLNREKKFCRDVVPVVIERLHEKGTLQKMLYNIRQVKGSNLSSRHRKKILIRVRFCENLGRIATHFQIH